MKVQPLFLCLFCFGNFLIAQNHTYQVELDGHRIGSFFQSVELDQSTHTFLRLNLQIKTLQDTIQYSQQIHFVESNSGELKSIEWVNVLGDTIRNQLLVKEDSIIRIRGKDRTAQTSETPLVGPEKIGRMSLQQLDTIGSNLKYWTFVTEFDKPMEVRRELMGFTIENAHRLGIVKESLDGNHFSIKKFDKSFNLIESESGSPFGKIRLIKTQNLGKTQFLSLDTFGQNRLNSNILFPDPKQINSIRVEVHGLDSISSSLIHGSNQRLTDFYNDSYVLEVNSEFEQFSLPKSRYLIPTAYFWPNAIAKNLIDSLVQGIQDSDQRVYHLVNYAKTQGRFGPLALLQLAIAAEIPARLVYGYAYDQWFWHPRYWVEIAQNDHWKTVDLFSEIESNTALKIALRNSMPGESFNEFQLACLPKLSGIKVESFELLDHKRSISNQIPRYYFENPVYENEGLGIRFNIPAGFEIANDGTKKPSVDFLSLINRFSETITFSQVIIDLPSMVQTQAKKSINHYLKNSLSEINYDKKLNLWHAFDKQRGAIAIAQGSSMLLIVIEHEDPEFIIELLIKKNLHLKY